MFAVVQIPGCTVGCTMVRPALRVKGGSAGLRPSGSQVPGASCDGAVCVLRRRPRWYSGVAAQRGYGMRLYVPRG
jgi:hypothetical protein